MGKGSTMIELNGKWIMEGLDRKDPGCIITVKELTGYINEIGFLPLMKNSVKGFSVEEVTASDAWWTGNDCDPWSWREIISTDGKTAYGKFFHNKVGFVSRECFPYLAAFRRDGYDFDSRYEDGAASRRAKSIMDILLQGGAYPSNELKSAAGFGKGGEKGFEGTLSQLQMQTYITTSGFHKRKNKRNEEYGWSIASYTLSERLFGEDHVRSQYQLGAARAKEWICAKIKSCFQEATNEELEKIIC